MANAILDVQISYDAGNKSPIVAGSTGGPMRLSWMNIIRLIGGLLKGATYKQGASYLQYTPTLVAASATATPASVINGNTVTIAGTALTAAQRRATGTLTCVSAIATDTVVINGVTFTGVAGAVVLGEATFSIDTGNTETATSIAAQVNAYASPLLSGILAARSATNVVTIYAITQGTAGNAITLATTGGTITRSAATLANGAALTNNTFDFAGTNATTGAALAAAINASTTAAIQRTVATVTGAGVVTITAKIAGAAGNAITLTSVGGTITVTGSGFLASGSQGEPVRLAL